MMELLEIVRAYVELVKLDPAYRDLYRQRACELLGPRMSRETYAGLRRVEQELARHKGTLEQAVVRHEWERVASLAGTVRATAGLLQTSATDLEVAREAYDAADVPIGPLSLAAARLTPGGGARFQAARVRALTLLAQVSEGDSKWASRLSSRRNTLEEMPDPDEHLTGGMLDEAQMEANARRALDRGQWEALERLAKAVHPEVAGSAAHCECGTGTPRPRLGIGPIDRVAVAAAASFGLVPVEIEAAPALHAYTSCRCAASPTLGSGSRDPGSAMGAHLCACQERCPEIDGALRENLDLLKHRLFVTSCGERYLPAFGAESLLLECFPEDATGLETRGPLLTALGISGRRGLSRWEVEEALAERGPELLARMELDPWIYRLVCVPFDVYQRLAPGRGWGGQPWWTHFDGYQVWRGWHLRALVGGNAHYGGPDDLTGIGLTDPRDNTVLRLAVVCRVRLTGQESTPGGSR